MRMPHRAPEPFQGQRRRRLGDHAPDGLERSQATLPFARVRKQRRAQRQICAADLFGNVQSRRRAACPVGAAPPLFVRLDYFSSPDVENPKRCF